jgi:hypothetical protein
MRTSAILASRVLGRHDPLQADLVVPFRVARRDTCQANPKRGLSADMRNSIGASVAQQLAAPATDLNFDWSWDGQKGDHDWSPRFQNIIERHGGMSPPQYVYILYLIRHPGARRIAHGLITASRQF